MTDAFSARAKATAMSTLSDDIFTPWIERWSLVADGPRFESPFSRSQLLPVLSGGEPAMLKVPTGEEAHRAAGLLVWYGGDGAARVMARDGPILLLERLTGDRDLATMACTGQDDEATRIVCDAIARLHTQRAGAPPELTPLPVYFRALATAACKHGGVLSKAAATAAELFAEHGARVVVADLAMNEKVAAARDHSASWRHSPSQHPRRQRARLARDRSRGPPGGEGVRLCEPLQQPGHRQRAR